MTRENYISLKTPSLHGKHSEYGAKEWQYYFLKDSYRRNPVYSKLEFPSGNCCHIIDY